MENGEFQIHSAYDHKALKTMARVLRKTMRRKRSIAVRIFGWCAVTLFALSEIALAAIGEFSWDLGNAAVILAVVVMLATLLFEDDLNAWIAAFSLIPGTREADTRFTPECYTVVTQAAETRWNYERIQAIGETQDSFVFMLSKRHTQQFPKAGMTSGTPDEFREFLTEKTGLPVRYVK